MSELKIFPLSWNEKGEEVNPDLHRLAKAFAEYNLSSVPDFRYFMKTWLLVATNGTALVEPWGITALRMEVDCPLFHMRTPEKSRDGVAKFIYGFEMMADRGRQYLADQGMIGSSIFVHVSEDSENASMVRHLTKRLALKPSHRLLMEV